MGQVGLVEPDHLDCPALVGDGRFRQKFSPLRADISDLNDFSLDGNISVRSQQIDLGGLGVILIAKRKMVEQVARAHYPQPGQSLGIDFSNVRNFFDRVGYGYLHFQIATERSEDSPIYLNKNGRNDAKTRLKEAMTTSTIPSF